MAGSKASSNAGRGVSTMVIAGIVAPVAVFAIPLVIVVSLMTILVALVQSQYGTTCGSDSLSSTSWVAWAKRIADDDSHGYSQSNRNGDPDYDCSSLVYYALKNAGLDVGSYAFNTTGEPAILEKAGFERHDWTKVADLQTGDVVWQSAHTEIYIGEGRFVGAHQDENGGISGGKAGDQTGDEISVTSYAAGYTAYFRYKGTGNIIGSSGTSNGQAVSGGTGSTELVGMSEQDAMAWFDGRQGPDDFCATYAYGQCTWWTCMRAKKLGWTGVGRYWGNGQDWASSGAKAGFRITKNAPVAGAIISWPAGVQGSDPTYGHVGVVESVDTAKGTITTSEKGAGYKVYSRTMPIVNGGTYVLPDDKITGAGTAGSSDVEQCVASSSGSDGDVDGTHASAEDAKKIARSRMKAYGWDDDDEYECLVQIWTRESGWRWNAENTSSGAYGIPQSLPGSKMASAGQDWRDNASTQIKWGFGLHPPTIQDALRRVGRLADAELVLTYMEGDMMIGMVIVADEELKGLVPDASWDVRAYATWSAASSRSRSSSPWA